MDDPPPPVDLAGRRALVDRVSLLAMLAVGALAVYVLERYLRDLDVGEVRRALAAMAWQPLALSGLYAAGGYLALVGYDWSALSYVGRRLRLPAVALASFCSYAIGNTAGFTLLTGGAVRLRLYSAAGLSVADIGRVTVFCMLAFGFGICTVSALSILTGPGTLAELIDVAPATVIAVGLLALMAIIGFLFFCGRGRLVRLYRWTLKLPTAGLVAKQLLISAVDIGFACAALYVLLPASSGISFLGFLPIFCAALAVGIMSHVPGGLGVFEAAILFALHDKLPKEQLVSALLFFRLVYYIIPLFMAILLLAGNEFLRRQGATSGDERRTSAATLWRAALGGMALVVLLVFIVAHVAGRSPATHPLPPGTGSPVSAGPH